MAPEEAPRTEEQGLDPVEAARGDFNRKLFGGKYQPRDLLTPFLNLQNAMITAANDPEEPYTELERLASQAAERAQTFGDEETAEVFLGLRGGYQLTREKLTTNAAVAGKENQPTATEDLPSMTNAKGNS